MNFQGTPLATPFSEPQRYHSLYRVLSSSRSQPDLLQRLLLSKFTFVLPVPQEPCAFFTQLVAKLLSLPRYQRLHSQSVIYASVTQALRQASYSFPNGLVQMSQKRRFERLISFQQANRNLDPYSTKLTLLTAFSEITNTRFNIYLQRRLEFEQVGSGQNLFHLAFLEQMQGLLLTDSDCQITHPLNCQVVLHSDFRETKLNTPISNLNSGVSFQARGESLVIEKTIISNLNKKTLQCLKEQSRTTLISSSLSRPTETLGQLHKDSLFESKTKKKTKKKNQQRTFGSPCESDGGDPLATLYVAPLPQQAQLAIPCAPTKLVYQTQLKRPISRGELLSDHVLRGSKGLLPRADAMAPRKHSLQRDLSVSPRHNRAWEEQRHGSKYELETYGRQRKYHQQLEVQEVSYFMSKPGRWGEQNGRLVYPNFKARDSRTQAQLRSPDRNPFFGNGEAPSRNSRQAW